MKTQRRQQATVRPKHDVKPHRVITGTPDQQDSSAASFSRASAGSRAAATTQRAAVGQKLARPVAARFRTQILPKITLRTGPEFELTTKELNDEAGRRASGRDGVLNASQMEPSADQMAAIIRRDFSKKWGLKVTGPREGIWGGHGFRVTARDGFHFDITCDPGCIEIKAPPQTLSEWKQHAAFIDEVAFGVARQVGLYPEPMVGAGHFNFDIASAFAGDPRHFFAFFSDFANHPELAEGVLGNDWANAPALRAIQPQRQLKGLESILADVLQRTERSIAGVVRRIYHDVYEGSKSPTRGSVGADPTHEQAFNLDAYVEETNPKRMRAELRCLYAQENAGQFMLTHELIQRRVAWTKAHADEIVFVPIPTIESKLDDRELVSRYYVYVAEMGGDWAHFRQLLPPSLVRKEPNRFVDESGSFDDPKYRELALHYAREAPASPFVRALLASALAQPGANKFPEHAAIVDLLEQQATTLSRKHPTLTRLINDLRACAPSATPRNAVLAARTRR
jgi:hypothetical protein